MPAGDCPEGQLLLDIQSCEAAFDVLGYIVSETKSHPWHHTPYGCWTDKDCKAGTLCRLMVSTDPNASNTADYVAICGVGVCDSNHYLFKYFIPGN